VTVVTTWNEFEQAAPELAGPVRARFEAAKHHVLATLRQDGSPRVSGTEIGFRRGELHLGSMPDARKAHDLRRDPRCALHAHTGDGTLTGGDAKLAGRAIEVTDEATLTAFRMDDQPPGPYHLFLLDLTEVVLTTVDGERLVMRTWRPGDHVRTIERT
jgi:hypothetical protein